MVRFEVGALVRVDDPVEATFDLDALARRHAQVAVPLQPIVGALHQYAARTDDTNLDHPDGTGSFDTAEFILHYRRRNLVWLT